MWLISTACSQNELSLLSKSPSTERESDHER
jgi:hypothetical protein